MNASVFSVDIHRWFHRAWLGLSVSASEAYVNALRNATVCQREALKLTAQVSWFQLCS